MYNAYWKLIQLGCVSLKSKKCYNTKPLVYYFYVKMKILVDFHICIDVPFNDTQREKLIQKKYLLK